ncbi:MAG: SurA N-terminal domain-containing protein, partial [Legionellales bacterium]|nr:SurA N-terminal domain-containing protein [Legionellales bacterium]
MLQKIQQRLSGWVLWIFVIIISLGFVLWGTGNYFQKSNNRKYEAIGTVNGVNILTNDVQRVFNVIASQIAQRNDNVLPQYMRPIIKEQAVNAVIFNIIISTLSKKLGYAYSKEEIESYLPSIDVFHENGRFSEDKFYRIISSQGYSSVDDFISKLKSDLISKQIRSGIFGTELFTDYEFEFWVKLASQKRNFAYLTIPRDTFIKEVKVEDKSIEEFYNKNIDGFKVGEKLRLEYVDLLADDMKKDVVVPQEDIKEYYEDNK